MNSIIRNVREIDSKYRKALEHVLGQPLTEDQRLIIQVEPTPIPPDTNGTSGLMLPDWCNVYAGLSDDEIAQVEAIALHRANLKRPPE